MLKKMSRYAGQLWPPRCRLIFAPQPGEVLTIVAEVGAAYVLEFDPALVDARIELEAAIADPTSSSLGTVRVPLTRSALALYYVTVTVGLGVLLGCLLGCLLGFCYPFASTLLS